MNLCIYLCWNYIRVGYCYKLLLSQNRSNCLPCSLHTASACFPRISPQNSVSFPTMAFRSPSQSIQLPLPRSQVSPVTLQRTLLSLPCCYHLLVHTYCEPHTVPSTFSLNLRILSLTPFHFFKHLPTLSDKSTITPALALPPCTPENTHLTSSIAFSCSLSLLSHLHPTSSANISAYPPPILFLCPSLS